MLNPRLFALLFFATPAAADTALFAVAANYATAAEAQAAAYKVVSGHDIQLTTGSTGKLYAQIGAGAPFDAMLSADAATPERLEAEGLAVAGSRFTYALGALVLWSLDPALIGPDPMVTLTNPDLHHLAIANPELAPYGVAAKQALDSLGLSDGLIAQMGRGGKHRPNLRHGRNRRCRGGVCSAVGAGRGHGWEPLAGAARVVRADPPRRGAFGAWRG